MFEKPHLTLACYPCRGLSVRRQHEIILKAAFCCLALPASPVKFMRWLVGAVGIEPTTFGLKGRCSTTELRP